MATHETAALTDEPVLLDGLQDPAPLSPRTTTEQAVAADVDRLLSRAHLHEVRRSADWVDAGGDTERRVERVTAVPLRTTDARQAFEHAQLALLTLDWPIEGNELDPPRVVTVSSDRTTRVEILLDGQELNLVARSAATTVAA